MKAVSPNWVRIAELADPMDTMRAIDINVKRPEDFQANRAQLRKLTITLDEDRPQVVLDFGAGMLRNTIAVRDFSQFWAVIAYDSESMLRRGWAAARFPEDQFPAYGRIRCEWDWSKIESVNAVLCSIVLQHLPEDDLREALADFAEISPWLCVWGRQRLDESPDKSVWQIIAETWDLRWGSDGLLENPDPEAHAFAAFHRR